MQPERLIIGVMTGTSLDAIDVAAVRVTGTGLSLTASTTKFGSYPLTSVSFELRELSSNTSTSPSRLLEIEQNYSNLIADAVADVAGTQKPDLVVVHGQTIFHNPPLTWQLLNPWPTVSRIGAPLLYDLRRADLAVGGQGAPLTPIADAVQFGHPELSRAIVNLGGFCNITLLPPISDLSIQSGAIRGFDLCPCNHWLDGIMRARTDLTFDRDGQLASSGSMIEPLLESLIGEWTRPANNRDSLGSNSDALFDLEDHSTEDLLATCCEAIARLIAHATRDCDEILLAGGSARNKHLTARIADSSNGRTRDLGVTGVGAEQREAVGFAVLGALCMDSIPIGLAHTTRATRPIVSGSWCLPSGPDTLSHA